MNDFEKELSLILKAINDEIGMDLFTDYYKHLKNNSSILNKVNLAIKKGEYSNLAQIMLNDYIDDFYLKNMLTDQVNSYYTMESMLKNKEDYTLIIENYLYSFFEKNKYLILIAFIKNDINLSYKLQMSNIILNISLLINESINKIKLSINQDDIEKDVKKELKKYEKEINDLAYKLQIDNKKIPRVNMVDIISKRKTKLFGPYLLSDIDITIKSFADLNNFELDKEVKTFFESLTDIFGSETQLILPYETMLQLSSFNNVQEVYIPSFIICDNEELYLYVELNKKYMLYPITDELLNTIYHSSQANLDNSCLSDFIVERKNNYNYFN